MRQFILASQLLHWKAILRVVNYPGHGLLYNASGHLLVETFSNLDGAGGPDNRRSTTGGLFLGGNVVTWKSKK